MTRLEWTSRQSLSSLQVCVCESLNVAPMIADLVIACAERRGERLVPYFLSTHPRLKRDFQRTVEAPYQAVFDHS